MKCLHFYIYVIFCVTICTSCSNKTAFIDQNQSLYIDKAIQIDSNAFGVEACEPSICINYKNPKNIVAGSILDNVYVSNDGGYTWTKSDLTSSFGVYGDPVVRADYQGNFFYSHLSNPKGKAWQSDEFLDRIVIQRSSDEGVTWNDGSHTPPDLRKDQDKQWLAIDPKTNHIAMSWTEFDKYDSTLPEDKSRILIVQSKDSGSTWSSPITLSQIEGNCLDDDLTTEGAVPAYGPNGELYVSWSMDSKIYFDHSFDGGKTWLDEDIVIADQPGGWAIDIPGISRCNGMPITEVDLSDGPHRGTIYVNWSDQKNGEDDTDIWLSKSTDKGKTWSPRVRVNNDAPGKQQFFTWMDVDPKTGFIYIVFYDRRDHDDLTTDVYLAYSKDGSQRFENVKINDKSFVPNKFIFFGDYNDISAYDGMIRPIWTQLDGMNKSVWTAIIEMK